jgi:S1-C subfamily serine protease
MAKPDRSLRIKLLAAGALVAGALLGIAFSARFEWIPTAGSADQPAAPPPAAAGPQRNFAPLAKAAMPAVVNISTTRVVHTAENPQAPPFLNDPFFRQFFGDQLPRFQAPRDRRESALGSGVIVSSDGYIVTNNHVVAKAQQIKVLLPDKREFSGKVIGTDPPTDIAVVKIDAKDLRSAIRSR